MAGLPFNKLALCGTIEPEFYAYHTHGPYHAHGKLGPSHWNQGPCLQCRRSGNYSQKFACLAAVTGQLPIPVKGKTRT